ncbi:MAG: NAD(P)/FAD-dependent oxidoreductase, partial [Nitrososphaera sp.]
LTPPASCEPFTDGRKSVGVGESIGTVYPLLGEGIIPSTWCAEIFLKNMHDLQAYRQAVIDKFKVYSLVFKFIQLKMSGKFSMVRHAIDMLKVYSHMKSEQDRYGMQVKMADMLKVSSI